MEKTKQQKAKDFIINNGVIIVMFILVTIKKRPPRDLHP